MNGIWIIKLIIAQYKIKSIKLLFAKSEKIIINEIIYPENFINWRSGMENNLLCHPNNMYDHDDYVY